MPTALLLATTALAHEPSLGGDWSGPDTVPFELPPGVAGVLLDAAPELVNNFHETGEYAPVPEVEEQVCDDRPARSDGVQLQEKACHTGPGSASFAWWGPAGLALPGRRRA